MNDQPDAVLLRRYLDDGEEAAFAELVRRYLGIVYHAALRQTGGDAHAAEEIAQTVFTLVSRKAASLACHETLAGWLHTTTRYTAHVHRRRESRRIRREEGARIMHEDNATETHPADWERLRPLIDDVLAELKAADREAILLRFFAGLAFAEIGVRLQVSENAARMRVERAQEKLHALLERRGVASTAGALGVALGTKAMASAPAGLAASVTSAALSSTALTGMWAGAGIFAMKTKSVLLASVAVLAVGVAVLQFNQAQNAEARLAAADRDRGALREQLRAASAKGGPAVRDGVVALPPPVSGPALQPVTDASGETPPQPAIVSKIKNAATRRIQSLDAQYRAFYHSRRFGEKQSARFRAILMENARRNEALTIAAALQDPRDPARQQAIDDQTNAELAAALSAEFGQDAVQAMEHHESTLPLRAPVEELAKTLFYTDTPLTAGQAERLIDAVAAGERNARGKPDFDWMVQTDFFAAMINQSAGVLSAAQVDVLRRLMEQSRPQPGGKKGAKPPWN